MAFLARAHKADRHDGVFLAINVTILAAVQTVQMDEPATAKALLGDLCFLNNEPFRKAPHGDARLKIEIAVGCRWWWTQSQRRNSDDSFEFLHETRLLNQWNLIHVVMPIVQPSDDDRGVGQVHHRTRAKRSDDLTGT